VQNEYNLDLKNFALSVSKAMNESTDFRKLIKEEALAKFDGDYDILLRNIVDKPIRVDDAIQLRSGGVNSTVKDLLEICYDSENIFGSNLRSSISVISELQQKYPNLQIAIPVNAEDWNEDAVPLVTFIPLEYKDGITQTFTAYDSNGKPVIIDAIAPPSEPVIVIGQNERIANILATVRPAAPINLTATQTQSGIQLSWSHHYGIDEPDFPIGYRIYRKSPQNDNFVQIKINVGMANTVCYDQATSAGVPYSYYVIAYNNLGMSPPSNIASIIATIPTSPASFEVLQHTNTQVELRWTTNDQNYQTIQLYKQEVGTNGNYQLYQEFGKNVYDYFDSNVQSGKRYNYRLQTVSATDMSNSKYDFIYVPYRNPAYNSAIRIKKVHSSDECEGWGRGAPEFTVKVLGVKSDGSTMELQTLRINFDGNMFGWDRTQNFNIFVLDWKPNRWYETISFYVEEEDDSSTSEVSLSASANYKVNDNLTMQTSGSIKTQIKKGYSIGYGYLDFFDPIDHVIQFPNSEFEITFGQ
jgi:hypothetical protein